MTSSGLGRCLFPAGLARDPLKDGDNMTPCEAVPTWLLWLGVFMLLVLVCGLELQRRRSRPQ